MKDKKILILGILLVITGIVSASLFISRGVSTFIFSREEKEPEYQRFITNCSPYIDTGFPRNLYYRDRGEDVKCWQTILNLFPESIVARRGMGSPGSEYSYFDSNTGYATARFEEKVIDVIPTGALAGETKRFVEREFFGTIRGRRDIGDPLIDAAKKGVEKLFHYRDDRAIGDCFDSDGGNNIYQGGGVKAKFFQKEDSFISSIISSVTKPFKSWNPLTGFTKKQDEERPAFLEIPSLHTELDVCIDDQRVKEWMCAGPYEIFATKDQNKFNELQEMLKNREEIIKNIREAKNSTTKEMWRQKLEELEKDLKKKADDYLDPTSKRRVAIFEIKKCPAGYKCDASQAACIKVPTLSPSPEPSPKPSPKPSPSRIPVATPFPTYTPSPTAVPTSTPTSSPTPTPTLSPSPSPSPNSEVSPTPTP